MTTGRLAGFASLALIVFTWLAPAIAAPEAEERRIALVIGVSAYKNAPKLATANDDARAVGESLRRLRFDVSELYDPDLQKFSRAIRNFGIRATAADVAVIYYAGHGMQVDGENFLIPSDARLERRRDLVYEAMPINRLLEESGQTGKIGIVLLDCCQNNPFIERVARSIALTGRAVPTIPGLARVDAVPRNTILVTAAKADQVADESRGEHSPFATALLDNFQIPGLELSLFFRSVRDEVLRATNNRQEPYVFSSLGADPFYFFPRPPNRPPQIAAINPLEVTDAAGPTPVGVPPPTDPDQDPLTLRIIGLPRSGEIRVEGRTVTLNSVYSTVQFQTATYKPDGKILGAVGTLDILVEDGRGGSVAGSLPISVKSSHHPPVVADVGKIHVIQQALSIPPPTSVDGDRLVVTIVELPGGIVTNGQATTHVGDRLTPEQLAKLTYTPEPGFIGEAGTLRYSVDNGHGSVVEGTAAIEVGSGEAAAMPTPAALLWGRVQSSTDPALLDAFLRLFPDAPSAAEARYRRDRLMPPAPPPALAPQVAAAPHATPAPIAPPPAPAEETQLAGRRAALLAGPPAPSRPTVMMAANNPAIDLHAAIAGSREFRDCPTCPLMARIDGGSYTMGLGGREPESMPPHRVDIRSFAIGVTPVTVAQWKACAAGKACSGLPRIHVAQDETPVHGVSWDDALTYAAWLTRVTGRPYRLPTEAEWEYAARGGTTTRYWWGGSAGMALANCSDCGGDQNPRGPLPVRALKPNPFGLYDMLGGVAQWVEDCWVPNYHGAPNDGSARDGKNCQKHVLRGGSFRHTRDQITVTSRGNYDGPVRYIANGFRVARDVE
ncbi:MAG: SUMF1/EgtB/PvdO family nonheme iron enzyme [Acetobacteraceae bacterium]